MAAGAYDVVVAGGTAGTFAAATAATEGARCRPPRAQERGGGWPHRLWRRAQGPGGVSRRRRPRSPHFGGILEPGDSEAFSNLLDVLSAVPGQQLVDVMASEDETSMGLRLKLQTLFGVVSHWDVLLELYRMDRKSTEIRDRYAEYPVSPDGFEEWRERRDDVLDDVYEITGAEPKY